MNYTLGTASPWGMTGICVRFLHDASLYVRGRRSRLAVVIVLKKKKPLVGVMMP